jgi:hypothetical protein
VTGDTKVPCSQDSSRRWSVSRVRSLQLHSPSCLTSISYYPLIHELVFQSSFPTKILCAFLSSIIKYCRATNRVNWLSPGIFYYTMSPWKLQVIFLISPISRLCTLRCSNILFVCTLKICHHTKVAYVQMKLYLSALCRLLIVSSHRPDVTQQVMDVTNCVHGQSLSGKREYVELVTKFRSSYETRMFISVCPPPVPILNQVSPVHI